MPNSPSVERVRPHLSASQCIFPAVHAALAAKQVEFEAPPHLVARMPDHDLWMAFLRDSEGKLFGLMSEARGSKT